jgi:pyrimidine operon attenuation protein/uracil phosphoribosyltransferase
MKYSKEQTQALLLKIENSLREYLSKNKIQNPIIIGVHTGGTWIADWLQCKLGYEGKAASLNISFYRDDFSRAGVNPRVEPTEMPVSIDDKHIILVDDVLFTGRTTRAAINEIFDFGRPLTVTLVVLIERNGKELPISADIVGEKMQLENNKNVKLLGPDPLIIEIIDKDL